MEAAQDSILFGMPEDPEIFLAALSTIQDYVTQLKKQYKEGRKEGGWFVAAHVVKELEFLKCCFPPEVVFVDEYLPIRGEWDYVFKFDVETAYSLSLPTEQHVTTSFGIMLGADPKELPDMSGLVYVPDWTKGATVLLLNFEGRDELAELISTHRPELGIAKSMSASPAYIFDYAVVVGPRSFETYVASAMGKTVLELYPDDRHQKWLSKWSGKYQMIYGSSFPVEWIYRGLEGLLERCPINQTQATI